VTLTPGTLTPGTWTGAWTFTETEGGGAGVEPLKYGPGGHAESRRSRLAPHAQSQRDR
jgi:hypothetical protein